MKLKRTWPLIIFIAAIIAAAVVYLVDTRPQPRTHPGATMGPEARQPSQEPKPKGAYLDYSEQALAQAQGRKLLFFHASWCPQCRQLEQSIRDLGVPDGFTIFKVDYDTALDLKQRYQVTLQTTVVEVDDQGNLLKKVVAYKNPNLDVVLMTLEGR